MEIKSNQNVTEPDLIKGCLNNDSKMQELLYHRFSAKMYAVCLRYCKDEEDAQDLLQEGFIKIFKNIGNYRNEGSFEGWIRRIFINTSIEHFRKKVREIPISDDKEIVVEDTSFSAFDNLTEKDIIKMIQTLSPGYRQVFNMYVIEGYTHKDIGSVLGITEGTSKSQLARAKAILKRTLETEFIKTEVNNNAL